MQSELVLFLLQLSETLSDNLQEGAFFKTSKMLGVTLKDFIYPNYLKYSNSLTQYHTSPKV